MDRPMNMLNSYDMEIMAFNMETDVKKDTYELIKEHIFPRDLWNLLPLQGLRVIHFRVMQEDTTRRTPLWLG